MKNSSAIKIADLGLATDIVENKKNKSFCGTVAYMAPEQKNHKPYDNSIDIWAIGIILFELLTLTTFDYDEFVAKKNIYLHKSFQPVLKYYDILFFTMVEDCLTINPNQRPSANELLESLIVTTPTTPQSSTQNPKNPFHPTKSMDENMDFLKDPDQSPRMKATSPNHSPKIEDKRNTMKNIQKIGTTNIVSASNSPISDTIEVTNTTPRIHSQSIHDVDVVKHWSFSQVSEWLKSLGMEEYSAKFLENEINGEALLELGTLEEFNYLGVLKLGHVKILQKNIKLMKKNEL
jgi:serine/threonine protein kinase